MAGRYYGRHGRDPGAAQRKSEGTTVFKIVKRRELNPTVTELVIEAPLIAKKAQAGQFIIIRAKADSERIPLTIAGYDREGGTVAIIFQVVGAGTMELNTLREGECVHDFVGPLGKATEIEGLKNVCVVGGGVGCAIALPVAQRAARRRAPKSPASSASATRTSSFSRTSSAPAATSSSS